jgi:hypothetical protein
VKVIVRVDAVVILPVLCIVLLSTLKTISYLDHLLAIASSPPPVQVTVACPVVELFVNVTAVTAVYLTIFATPKEPDLPLALPVIRPYVVF